MTRVTMKKGRLEGSLKKIIIKIKPFTGYYLLVSFLFILSFSFSLRLSVSVWWHSVSNFLISLSFPSFHFHFYFTHILPFICFPSYPFRSPVSLFICSYPSFLPSLDNEMIITAITMNRVILKRLIKKSIKKYCRYDHKISTWLFLRWKFVCIAKLITLLFITIWLWLSLNMYLSIQNNCIVGDLNEHARVPQKK